MKKVVLILCLILTGTLWATEPQTMVKSAGQLAWEAVPDTLPDAEQVRIAREFLDQYPNDIPLLRSVQNVLNRKSDLTVDFWKERMDKSPTTANRYLYARKANDPAISKEQAEWMMKNDAGNFWGYYLAAVTEWSKETPDMKVVIDYFDQAIAKDPSRPEGWYYCGDANEQAGNLDRALQCYQAAKVVEPDDTSLNMSILGIYAQKRDADNYFALAAQLLPKEPPLQVELGMHNSGHKMTASDFSGQYTVLELFTYW